MFNLQKQQLAEASLMHRAAIQRKNAARQKIVQKRQQFLSEPLNLLYPYSAGILVCASQLKNEATGLKRIPFMNIAKAGIGIWTLIYRIRRIIDSRSTRSVQLDSREEEQVNAEAEIQVPKT